MDDVIQEEAEHALEHSLKTTGSHINHDSWRIMLMWSADDVNLDLHFYEKQWLNGEGAVRNHGPSVGQIYNGAKVKGPFSMVLADMGGRHEHQHGLHVESIELVGSSDVPDGEYGAFVELREDRRSKNSTSPVSFQLVIKGVNGQHAHVACPAGEEHHLACAFDAPSQNFATANIRRLRPDRAHFHFKVKGGRLEFMRDFGKADGMFISPY